MKRLVFLCLCWTFIFPEVILASPTANLKSGDKTAQEFLNQLEAKKQEAGNHPFYSGHSEAAKLKSRDLTGRAQSLSQSDPASQMLYQSADSRPQVKIDRSKDPLLTGSQRIMTMPLEVIGGKGTRVVETQQGNKDEILTCEEPGDDSLESCTRQLVVKVIKTKVLREKYEHFHLTGCKKSHKPYHVRSCPALLAHVRQWRSRRIWKKNAGPIDITAAFKACLQEVNSKKLTRCYRCNNPRTIVPIDLQEDQIQKVLIERNNLGQPLIQGKTHLSRHGRLKVYNLNATIKITYEEETYTILPDEWASNCEKLEARVDQGLCHYDTKECTQGPQTRIIEGIPITRDCWQEKLTYACDFPTKDNCGPLRARGCVQINSSCKQNVGNTCVAYTQTYQCKGNSRTSYQITGGNTPFCLDGSCRDQSLEANNEMMSSLAQLALLKDMQGKINSIFEGDEHQCSKHILSFKDCCGSGKGWGKSLGLGGCKSKEKLLHEKRKGRLCHYVGTYCAKKVLGQCVKKKSSFCCFGSKLLKAFQEQGRKQINLGWGKAKKPLCRGFTIEEIQRIDFSKLDLREAFEDLMKNYKPQKLQGMGEKIGERLDIIKKGVAPGTKKQQKQRPEA
ncbi:MAG: conjugal transfer protein TraN [Alphaproteobacteria bacterium]|jgi:conjugal transfer mating pair stabilization protein TraN|nr:conjugal transfer protein TraN [Alphaproteobacteria bacterium]MBP9776814.1 conjugal transfer protein TraN [Alphaproteobacteria bacterium]